MPPDSNNDNGFPVRHDPWMILVSEVMLQQTQTTRVIERLPKFLEQFPTPDVLARASRGEVLRAWEGMGYNSRALRLQETAKALTRLPGVSFPDTYEDLSALPGIGPYTASAILCFAFGRQVAVVDVNVVRVYSRLFYRSYIPSHVQSIRDLQMIAQSIVPAERAYDWHQAIMDLGATICTALRPDCDRCPVNKSCLSGGRFLTYSLFAKENRNTSEPMIGGKPRRFVRGKIVQLLREERNGIPVRRLVDIVALWLGSEFTRPDLESELLDLLVRLNDEGLVMRTGRVQDGDLTTPDYVSLHE